MALLACRAMRGIDGVRARWTLVLAIALLACAPGAVSPARATSFDDLPVGDPLERELRILDLLGPDARGARIRLPHLFTRPLQRFEIEGAGEPLASPGSAAAISIARLERALQRDSDSGFVPHPEFRSTRRTFATGPRDQRFEVSAGLEGAAESDFEGRRFASGSGLHSRVAVGVDRWLAYSHLILGRIANARLFADPIVPNNDLIIHTEETYLAYTGERGKWRVQFGRTRWHWGPGDEASLILSKTSAPLSGLLYHLRVEPLRADATALSATLDQAAGEQLAAHRLEWQPSDGLRLGLTEAARYHSTGWQPLYAVGAIPYVLVQRLLVQDEPDSLRAHRNNILVGFDAAWRPAPGTRLYLEGLVDDLHAKTANNPNKYGYQFGWEGVGTIGRTRVNWNTEYTRLTRFVYTSFFGRTYAAQSRPIGFPTGPDARRIRIRGAWDLNRDWQIEARVARTDHGENSLAEPFLPGSPQVDVARFEGIVEQSREADLALRWSPASGVDLRMLAGRNWIENAGHAQGARAGGSYGALEVRLTR
jgi:Capsule assembly protein Wzi